MAVVVEVVVTAAVAVAVVVIDVVIAAVVVVADVVVAAAAAVVVAVVAVVKVLTIKIPGKEFLSTVYSSKRSIMMHCFAATYLLDSFVQKTCKNCDVPSHACLPADTLSR